MTSKPPCLNHHLHQHQMFDPIPSLQCNLPLPTCSRCLKSSSPTSQNHTTPRILPSQSSRRSSSNGLPLTLSESATTTRLHTTLWINVERPTRGSTTSSTGSSSLQTTRSNSASFSSTWMQSAHSRSTSLASHPFLLSHLQLFRYCFKLLCTSELETTDSFAMTNTIEDCIRGATNWAEHRQNLRDIASEFTTNEKLLVCPFIFSLNHQRGLNHNSRQCSSQK